MITKSELRGVTVASVTPFTEDGKLDEESLRRITNYLLKKGVHGIMTTGGNGEGAHLLREERRAVTQIVVSQGTDTRNRGHSSLQYYGDNPAHQRRRRGGR